MTLGGQPAITVPHNRTEPYEQVDLLNSNLATTQDLDALRHSHDAKLQSAKYDIIKWIYPAFVIQSILIVALYKLL